MTTFAEQHRAYTSGTTTPVAVAEAFLAADPVGGTFGAFRDVRPDDVLAQARAAGDRFAAGAPLGPMDGVLVGIKDFFAVDGYQSLGGTRDLTAHGRGDAAAVARLRSAGAVIAGKTHCTELGLSPVGASAAQPTPRNPHALDHLPGGSSSGTGAAVAAGLVTAGLASDGGGSVRIPAALCGVYGIKPSWGVVPNSGGMPVGWWSLDHLGPIARSAQDLATALAVMADRSFDLDARPLRYGVDWTWWGHPDPLVDSACRAVAAELSPTEVAIRGIELASVAGYVTALSELTAGIWDVLRDRPQTFSADVRAQVALSPTISGADYVRAQQVRQLLADAFDEVFTRVDVVLVPTTAQAAAPRPADDELASGVVDADLIEAMTAYAFPANLCGLPAATVPVGVTPTVRGAGGLPIGLQIVGPRGGDATVLSAVDALERAGLAARPHPASIHATLPAQ